MKKILFALSLLFSLGSLAQSFEGEIIYKNALTSKSPKITDEQWIQMLGATQRYYIKGGNYKSVTNGTMTQWQLYISKENKLYTKMSNSEAVLWNDAAVNTDEVLKSEVKKNAEVILGYPCDELTLTCKSGVQKFYYSARLPVDSKLYEQHKYGNWYEFLKNSNAMMLKTVIENPQFVLETTAQEVKPVKLEDKLFTLPEGTKTEKSPY